MSSLFEIEKFHIQKNCFPKRLALPVHLNWQTKNITEQEAHGPRCLPENTVQINKHIGLS